MCQKNAWGNSAERKEKNIGQGRKFKTIVKESLMQPSPWKKKHSKEKTWWGVSKEKQGKNKKERITGQRVSIAFHV